MAMVATLSGVLERVLVTLVVAASIRAYDENMEYFKGSENTTFDKLTIWIAGSEIEHYVGE